MPDFINGALGGALLAGAFTLFACGSADAPVAVNGQLCEDGDCTLTSSANTCAPNPCQHGGSCRRDTYSYTCECERGFTGDDCEIPPDDCAAGPCLHGGTCSSKPAGGFSCACPAGFDGVDCGHDVDDCAAQPCQNGGACTDGPNSYSCACAPGFDGDDCEHDIDDCAAHPCQHGGTCADRVNRYRCTCAEGFDGDDCEHDIDDCAHHPCQNDGTCHDGVASHTCTCVAGFGGADCSINVDDCADEPCQNGGICSDGVNGFSCACLSGFAGADCSINVDDCADEPCQNGGVCSDSVDAYTCSCPSNYTGPFCEADVDECLTEADYCDSAATCTNTQGSYTCECDEGFEGDGFDCGSTLISQLSLSTGPLSPAFQPDVESYTQTISCDRLMGFTSGALLDPDADVSLSYHHGSSSSVSSPNGVVPLTFGTTTIDIGVTSSGATPRTYEIAIERLRDDLECSVESFYKFEETALGTAPSGTDFADGAGRESHLTATGAVTPGVVGFDGTGKAVSLPGTVGVFARNSTTLNLAAASLSFWMKADALPAPGTRSCPVGFVNGPDASAYDKDVFLDSDGKLTFYVFDSSGLFTSLSAPITTGTWHHVVATAGSPTSTLYLDGVLAGTVSSGPTFTGYSVPNLFVGPTTSLSTSAFAGSVDELSVWNRALDAGEASLLFSATAFGTCTLTDGVPDCSCGGSNPGSVVCAPN